MDVIKSSRFWLALIIMIGAFVLAICKQISGTEALAASIALLAGFGVAKTQITKMLPIILLPAVMLSGCASTLTQLNRVHEATKMASSIIEPAYHAKCLKLATACAAVKDVTCAPWRECNEQRNAMNKVIKGIHVALASGMMLDGIGDDKGTAEKVKSAALALKSAYDLAKKHCVLEDFTWNN